MKARRQASVAAVLACALMMAGLMLAGAKPLVAEPPGTASAAPPAPRDATSPESACEPAKLGSPYIPVDSWLYAAVLRLYSLGYVDAAYVGLRPWTRASLMHMLE
ncbi:MAG: hypothetical protein ACLQG3_16745, partial [Terracidiphilus sp.]